MTRMLALGALVLAAAAASAPAQRAANASCWNFVPSPLPKVPAWGTLNDVSVRSPTDAWAVGWRDGDDSSDQLTYAQHWDGKAWTSVPTDDGPRPYPIYLNELKGVTVVGRTEAWAVGSYRDDPDYEPIAERWDGSRWKIYPMPGRRLGVLNGVDASSPKDVWAVGERTARQGLRYALIYHWNGTAWQSVAGPRAAHQGARLYAVDVRTRRDAWAVGARDWGRQLLVLHWNGRHWRYVPMPKSAGGELRAVTTQSRRSAWAVGFADLGLNTRPFAAHWDGRRWHVKRTPPGSYRRWNMLYAAGSRPGAAAWIGGSSSDTEDFPHVLLQRWGGRRWRNHPFRSIRVGKVNAISFLNARDGWAVGTYSHASPDGPGYGPLTIHFGPC